MANSFSLENFGKALGKLGEFVREPVKNERDMAGIIQAFEYTFELAWKALQAHARQEGLELASPKRALQYAMSAGFILVEQEEHWLRMLEDRNLTSHVYHEKTAMQVSDRIMKSHLPHLSSLHRSLSGANAKD